MVGPLERLLWIVVWRTHGIGVGYRLVRCTMQIPSKFWVTLGDTYLDGGTISLHAISDAGERCEIRLNQHTWNAYENPGRLFFNDEIVEIRSDNETKIILLLEKAVFDSRVTEDNRLGLGKDGVKRLVKEVITFVKSAEYIDIAKNGVPERQPMSDADVADLVKHLLRPK
jgi:hypothetical protein